MKERNYRRTTILESVWKALLSLSERMGLQTTSTRYKRIVEIEGDLLKQLIARMSEGENSPFWQSCKDGFNMTIYGQPPAKSNCYRIIKIGGHGSLAKTKELMEYEEKFILQIPNKYKGLMIDKVFRATITYHFKTRASDLDNAWKATLDCLQKAGVIKNDNLMIEQIGYKFIDKLKPRAEIKIKVLG